MSSITLGPDAKFILLRFVLGKSVGSLVPRMRARTALSKAEGLEFLTRVSKSA